MEHGMFAFLIECPYVFTNVCRPVSRQERICLIARGNGADSPSDLLRGYREGQVCRTWFSHRIYTLICITTAFLFAENSKICTMVSLHDLRGMLCY